MYVKMKKKECDKIGIEYKGFTLDNTITHNQIM